MEHIIEKITLYDLLGFGFPGFLMLFILLLEFLKVVPDKAIELMQDYEGMLAVIVIVLNYIVGLLLSEISAQVIIYCSKLHDEMNTIVKRKFDTVDTKDLNAALSNSGSAYKADNEHVFRYIYSVIQVDPEFNRIHSYASAEVMSKNIAMACLIGGMMACALCFLRYVHWFNNGYRCRTQFFVALGLFLCSWLMNKRRIRFFEKRVSYSVNWFILKYHEQQDGQNHD